MTYWWEQYVPYIQSREKQTGIPTAIVLSQMILESGATSPSGLAKNANNLFGVKGSGSAGSYKAMTTEEVNGKNVRVMGSFAKYNSPNESIDNYIRLLQKPRYAEKVKGAKTLNEFATGIWKGGYATDSIYVSKLMNQVQSYGLDKYNVNKDIKFIPGANIGPATDTTATNVGFGSGITDPVVNFLKSAETNFLKFAIYTVLFIVAVWFFFQAINSVPVVKEASNQLNQAKKTMKDLNSSTKKSGSAIKATGTTGPTGPTGTTGTTAKKGTGLKEAGKQIAKTAVKVAKYIPK